MKKNMIEPTLESNQLQLTENVRLQFDKLNKTLLFKRVKKEGKGPNAKPTNEYTYGNEKYFTTYEHLVKSLLNKEFTSYVEVKVSEEEKRDLKALLKAIENSKNHINETKKQISENLKNKIEITIGKNKED